MKRKVYALLLVVGIAGSIWAGAGCTRPGERKAEKVIEELLPQYLGPARSYRAQVKASSLGALLRGRVRSVKIVGEDVQLLPDCTVAELRVEASELAVDRGSSSLKSVGKATFQARIDAVELDRLVRARRPKLANLQLRVVGHLVQVRVTPEVLGYRTVPIEVEGSLVPRREGVSLDFEPDSARVLALSIPRPVLDFVAERLNPVVDLSALRVPIRVQRTTVSRNALTLHGYIPPESLTALGSGR